ncbi:MAG: tyrosine-type recombinase/integrase [Cyclobacteriaceae bacterium]|nr:tyrosine-type recombinase/integrase [Cyclobacteriaceae bacterium]
MKETFYKYLRFEKRFSPHTLTSYQTDLEQFYSFLSGNHPDINEQEIGHSIIRQWIVSLVDTGLKTRSVNRKITTLKSFFNFLTKRGFIGKNPSLQIHVLKTSKTIPDFIRPEETHKMLEPELFDSGFEGMRDHLIFELLYGTGIRLSELIGLKTSDVDFNKGHIRVLGKRNKERLVPVTDYLSSLIKSYLDKKFTQFGSNASDALIVNNSGRKAYPMMIYRIVHKHLQNYTHADKKSPHVLRHTYATHLLDRGADLSSVKELLGHQSLAATQVYTHNSLDKLKKVFDRAHPKA